MDDIIVNCIKEVEKLMGNYYKENVYQNALYVELWTNNILSQCEVVIPVLYKGVNVGFERADIVIYLDNNIEYILELKSQCSKLGQKEINQLRKYMNNTGCKKGYLVNFFEKLELYKLTETTYDKI